MNKIKDDILSYREMCDIENVQTLQRGMNYRLNPSYSVILMSQRSNAPYKDKIYDDGFNMFNDFQIYNPVNLLRTDYLLTLLENIKNVMLIRNR